MSDAKRRSYDAEMSHAARVIEYEREHLGVLLWWVALITKETDPAGIMAASIHEDPMARLGKLWHGLYGQRAQPKTATWRIVVAPVHFDGSEDDLAIIVTLPRDRPFVVMERDPEMPPLDEEYVLDATERAALARHVPRDLGRPRPYLKHA